MTKLKFLLCPIILLSLIGCSNEDVMNLPSNIIIDEGQSTMYLEIGDAQRLKCYNGEKTIDDISWHSSNYNVVSIDIFGNIEALHKGKATITASTEGRDEHNNKTTLETKLEIVVNPSYSDILDGLTNDLAFSAFVRERGSDSSSNGRYYVDTYYYNRDYKQYHRQVSRVSFYTLLQGNVSDLNYVFLDEFSSFFADENGYAITNYLDSNNVLHNDVILDELGNPLIFDEVASSPFKYFNSSDMSFTDDNKLLIRASNAKKVKFFNAVYNCNVALISDIVITYDDLGFLDTLRCNGVTADLVEFDMTATFTSRHATGAPRLISSPVEEKLVALSEEQEIAVPAMLEALRNKNYTIDIEVIGEGGDTNHQMKVTPDGIEILKNLSIAGNPETIETYAQVDDLGLMPVEVITENDVTYLHGLSNESIASDVYTLNPVDFNQNLFFYRYSAYATEGGLYGGLDKASGRLLGLDPLYPFFAEESKIIDINKVAFNIRLNYDYEMEYFQLFYASGDSYGQSLTAKNVGLKIYNIGTTSFSYNDATFVPFSA